LNFRKQPRENGYCIHKMNERIKNMGDVGEKKFLGDLLPKLFVDPMFVNGFGQDASVIDLGLQEQLLVMKIDRAASPIASVHGWENYRLWGRLAVTANCSDILATGASPKAMMLSVCVPRDWTTKDVCDIVLGCEEECRRWNVAFVGGDTKEAPHPQVIGSAIGIVNRDDLLTRHKIRPGQLLVIAGSVGGYIGSYLQLTCRHPDAIASKHREEWMRYLSFPTARWAEARAVRLHGSATAAMDTSDGLYDTLLAMGAGKVGVEIALDSIPYHPAAIECSKFFAVPIFNTAFSVGDWNIIYSVDKAKIGKLMADAQCNKLELAVIGEFIERPGVFARGNKGELYSVNGVTNEHFVQRMEDEKQFVDSITHQITLELL
jgi:thiamine-monophosphate kinase